MFSPLWSRNLQGICGSGIRVPTSRLNILGLILFARIQLTAPSPIVFRLLISFDRQEYLSAFIIQTMSFYCKIGNNYLLKNFLGNCYRIEIGKKDCTLFKIIVLGIDRMALVCGLRLWQQAACLTYTKTIVITIIVHRLQFFSLVDSSRT